MDIIFFQIKAIRKGAKPPIWRRAFVPSNITYAQLALILEEILELPYSDRYEFEFYTNKYRLIEWQEEDDKLGDYYYSYLNAPDTYINEWMLNEKWFTFRLRLRHGEEPEYRVEIEKALKDVILNRETGEALNSPLILKEVSVKGDVYWTNAAKINDLLKERYYLNASEAEYLNFSELQHGIQLAQGIGYCEEMVDRNIHSKKSADAMLQELSDTFLNTVVAKRVQELKSNLEIDDETGRILSTEDEIRKETEKLISDLAVDMKQHVHKSMKESMGSVPTSNKRRNSSLEDLFRVYTKQDLLDIAEEIGYHLVAARKDKMAYELARYLLTPDTMRELLLMATTEELDAFEEAMEQECHKPTDEEVDKLATLIDLNYIVVFEDDWIEVPDEVIVVYKILQRNDYRTFHKKAYWMIQCLRCFDVLYVVAPTQILYRMYRQNKEMSKEFNDFMSVLQKLPDRLNPCHVEGGKTISKQALKDNIYKKIEANQRDVDYYVPTMQEIPIYAGETYPICEEAYKALEDFWRNDMKMSDRVCIYLCSQAFRNYSMGYGFSDYMDILNAEEIVFESDRQLEKFASIMMNVNNNTRMFDLRGHKPNEMNQYRNVYKAVRNRPLFP